MILVEHFRIEYWIVALQKMWSQSGIHGNGCILEIIKKGCSFLVKPRYVYSSKDYLPKIKYSEWSLIHGTCITLTLIVNTAFSLSFRHITVGAFIMLGKLSVKVRGKKKNETRTPSAVWVQLCSRLSAAPQVSSVYIPEVAIKERHHAHALVIRSLQRRILIVGPLPPCHHHVVAGGHLFYQTTIPKLADSTTSSQPYSYSEPSVFSLIVTLCAGVSALYLRVLHSHTKKHRSPEPWFICDGES